MSGLLRSEVVKLTATPWLWIIAAVCIVGGLPLAWINATAGAEVPDGDPSLYYSEPIPVDRQGFEMAGYGYVFIIVIGALWAGSEYGAGRQLRTTFLATPRRGRVFAVKVLLIALTTLLLSAVTMVGTIMITHLAGDTGVDPLTLSPAIWEHLLGLITVWTLTGLIAFSLGIIARTAILPLIVMLPLVVGIGDFLAGLSPAGAALPVVSGAAVYAYPPPAEGLDPVVGLLVHAGWAAVLTAIAATLFIRRDVV